MLLFLINIRIQAAEMRFLRPTVGYTLLEKKRSSDIREQLGIFNVNDKLTQYRINWRNTYKESIDFKAMF